MRFIAWQIVYEGFISTGEWKRDVWLFIVFDITKGYQFEFQSARTQTIRWGWYWTFKQSNLNEWAWTRTSAEQWSKHILLVQVERRFSLNRSKLRGNTLRCKKALVKIIHFGICYFFTFLNSNFVQNRALRDWKYRKSQFFHHFLHISCRVFNYVLCA